MNALEKFNFKRSPPPSSLVVRSRKYRWVTWDKYGDSRYFWHIAEYHRFRIYCSVA